MHSYSGCMAHSRASGAEHRRRAILTALESEPRELTIAELSAEFEVSDMTIRRDLDSLMADGRVQRTHGGAVLSHAAGVEPRYAAKQKVNAALKTRIARYAAEELVADGDVIILEGGTTVTAMAQYLRGKEGLTVLTNGLYTVHELRHLLPGATVMSTGGILRDVSFTFVGPAVEEFLEGFHARRLFVSATGLTLERGYTDPNPLEAQVRKAMAASADETVALIDSTKFGVVSVVSVAPVGDVATLVTDLGAPQGMVSAIRDRGVDVRLV